MRPSLRSLQIAYLLLSATSTTTFAQQPVAPRLQTGFNAIREGDLRSNLTFIAGDGLEGRMSLQPGDDAAAEWVASEFAKAGLQPAATDVSGKPSFLEPVPLIEYKPDPSATLLSLSRSGGAQQQWHAPVVSGGFRENVDASGGLVYVGYGITAPELNYDDYAGVDARGKIVVLMEHEPQEDDPKSIFNGTGNTRYATSRVKLLNAQKHGAIAVLLMPEPNARHVSTAKRLANVFAGATAKRLTPIPLQSIADDEVRIPLMTIPLTVADELFQSSGATAKDLQTSIDRDLRAQSREIAGVQVHLQTKNISCPAATPRSPRRRSSSAATTTTTARLRSRSRAAGTISIYGTEQTTMAPARSASSNWRTPSRSIPSNRSDLSSSLCLHRKSAGSWARTTWRSILCVRWPRPARW